MQRSFFIDAVFNLTAVHWGIASDAVRPNWMRNNTLTTHWIIKIQWSFWIPYFAFWSVAFHGVGVINGYKFVHRTYEWRFAFTAAQTNADMIFIHTIISTSPVDSFQFKYVTNPSIIPSARFPFNTLWTPFAHNVQLTIRWGPFGTSYFFQSTAAQAANTCVLV